jgi:hypothetical protein
MQKIRPYLQTRYMPNDIKKLNEIFTSEAKKNDNWLANIFGKLNVWNKITNKLDIQTLSNYGDFLSVIYGGYARYQTQIENGMSEEEALKDMEMQTLTTQQSGLKSLKGNLAKKNGYMNIMSNMFKSQEQQYLSKTTMNIIRALKGDDNNFLGTMMMYNLFTPLLMTAVGGVINNMTGKDDKEWEEYVKDFAVNVGLSFFGVNYIIYLLKMGLEMNYKSIEYFMFETLDTITEIPVSYTKRAWKNWTS